MRVQFIELHEQPWFPSTIRDEITDAMQFGLRILRVYSPVIPVLQNVLEATHSRCIVDLCSGSGGPWFDLQRQLQEAHQILLTDKYPKLDPPIPESLSGKASDNIVFYSNPVDALNIPANLHGLRTLFSSFHHFRPEYARALLQNAVDAGEGICIFEASKRDAITIALNLSVGSDAVPTHSVDPAIPLVTPLLDLCGAHPSACIAI